MDVALDITDLHRAAQFASGADQSLGGDARATEHKDVAADLAGRCVDTATKRNADLDAHRTGGCNHENVAAAAAAGSGHSIGGQVAGDRHHSHITTGSTSRGVNRVA